MTIFKFLPFTSRLVLQIQKDYIHFFISFPNIQVVVVATYFYFGLSLIGSQELDTDNAQMFFPIILVLKFIFFIGWLKVGSRKAPLGLLARGQWSLGKWS